MSTADRIPSSQDACLDSDRFRLSLLDAADEPLYARIYTDPAMMENVGPIQSGEEAKQGFDRLCSLNGCRPFRYLYWKIACKSSGSTVGIAALMKNKGADAAELGMMVLPEWQARGVAKELVPLLVEHRLKHCQVGNVVTRHLPSNLAGAQVMQGLGFSRVWGEDSPDWIRWEYLPVPSIQ